ncbi:hypothetical protein ERJ75_000997200 [Trypanosoma vivax]|uniref:Uncharacterized protein n=1 Tax=Trypanosoma vivax (strain Y486) TaxID=1055687 RepID=G0UAT7_TRYVY|nr:hypothetical protein TRVL_02140 [Trypanosoma vivax]KAH8611775.1 hypothetical protein ERJ75_000997200 [Trypanosoma vivax]CCC52924.1 conserved hypothetical protein [Trypanosoma vivax Y486]
MFSGLKPSHVVRRILLPSLWRSSGLVIPDNNAHTDLAPHKPQWLPSRQGCTSHRRSVSLPRKEGKVSGTQHGVNTKSGAAERLVVLAFQTWSRETGGCSPEEFMQGVRQSYRCLGVLLQTLSEAVLQQKPIGKAISLENALIKLKTLLVSSYGVAVDPIEREMRALKTSGEETANVCKVVGGLLTQVLPLSQSLAESIYTTWNEQRTFDSNLFCIASPNDYVLTTKMVFFHASMNTTAVAMAKGATPEPAAAEHGGPSPECDVDQSAITAGEGLREVRVYKAPKSPSAGVVERDPVLPAFTGPEQNVVGKKGGGEEEKQEMFKVLVFKEMVLKPIPASAPAVVLTTVDVVAPPQRYYQLFDWFYKRIVGHENEYERIEVARTCARSSARSVIVFLDFLKRMFTGNPIEIECDRVTDSMHGGATDLSNCPPAMRKMLCFYMDNDRRWILFDVVAMGHVLTPLDLNGVKE